MKDNKNKQTQNINFTSSKMTISNTLFMLKICVKTAPLYMFFFVLEAVMHEVQVFFEHTYGIKFILEVIEFHKPAWYGIAYMCGLMVYIMIVQFFTGRLFFSLEKKSRPRIIEALRLKIFDKAHQLDLSNYDDPVFYNDFVLASGEADKCVERLFTTSRAIVSGVTSAIVCGSYFLFLDPGSSIFIILPVVSSLVLGKVLNKIEFKRTISLKPLERKRDYIHRVFYLTDYAKEIRLNPEMKKLLLDEFNTSHDKLLEGEKKYTKKRWLLSFLRQYLFTDFVGDALFIVYLVYKAAVLHTISYSSVVVMFNTSGNIKHGMREVANKITEVAQNSLFIGKIREFLNTKLTMNNDAGIPVPNKSVEIELKNVCFGYGKKQILNNISLQIHPYEKIALVGYNGAGKTTLVKLLMRLYDPISGEILLDGKSLKEYNSEALHKKTGVVFQDYKLFAVTLRENVKMNDSPVLKEDDELCLDALKDAGFEERYKKLNEGLNTPLTREFEEKGTDLSGGESQKVAIARVLYKDAGLVILDEPSSALDPIAEYNLNLTIHQTAAKRSVVFISHRLSTTRDADRIILLEKGSITEEGTHEELLQKGGVYSKMWNAQAGRYLED